jgi:hypothetical protein
MQHQGSFIFFVIGLLLALVACAPPTPAAAPPLVVTLTPTKAPATATSAIAKGSVQLVEFFTAS